MSLGSVDPLWLVAGVVLHLCSQLARGRGWHSVICAAHPDEVHPRRRDVLATWIAGAGASGVLSARGGDALRILLMKRHMKTTCPRLIGTLAAETVAETALGALLTVWALSAGLVPGLHRPGLATAALVVMVAHSSGRLLPFSPASAATSLGLLVAAFPAVTHTNTGAGELTAFYLGSTGLLTVVGIGFSALVLVRELGLAGARRVGGEALERLRVPRKAPVRVPAA